MYSCLCAVGVIGILSEEEKGTVYVVNYLVKLYLVYIVVFNPRDESFCKTRCHLHPLLVEICDSNSRLVVDEDDNGKFRLETVNRSKSDMQG